MLKKEFYNILIALGFVFIFQIQFAFAQQQTLPLNLEYNNWIEKDIFQAKEIPFTSIKPFVASTIAYDSLLLKHNSVSYKEKKRNWIGRKLLQENFILIDTGDLKLTIDPVAYMENGRDNILPDSNLYRNARGLLVKGSITNNFSFETSFYENQAFFPGYVSSFITKYEVSPGSGRVKTFKTNGYDYAMSSGHFTYAVKNKFFVQAGHGKHFVGNGYRSVLLSDNAFNYPYLKLTYQGKNFYYSSMYASFQVVQNGRIRLTSLNEGIFRKKTASFQFLGYKPHRNVELMFFQGIIWQTRTAQFPRFNFNSLNPIIGVNALTNGWQSRNNVVMGLNANIKLHKSILTYAQLALDDFDPFKNSIKNKNAWQIGLKFMEPLGFKNFYLQAEYNVSRPYTYSHKKPDQSYTHYNQPLANPLGANYKETVVIANYNWKRIYFYLKLNSIQTGIDSSATNNSGKELLISNNSASDNPAQTYQALQGIKTKILYKEARISFLLNPSTNLNVFAGFTFRDFKNSFSNLPTQYIYLGIRTSLTNTYFDF